MDWAKPFITQYKLIVALSLAILIALILTAISLNMYITSGVSGLDLSRPGYEGVRDQIKPNTSSQSFSADGPLNPSEIDKFDKLYSDQANDLNVIDDFSNKNLEDESLRFTPESQGITSQ